MVMEYPVKYSAGERGVVVEDGWPLFEYAIRRQDDATAFVATAEDLKQQIGTLLVDRQIPQFVDDKDVWLAIFCQLVLEAMLGVGCTQHVDHVDRRGEENTMAGVAGLMGKCDRQVRFAQPASTDQNDVGVFRNEVHREQLLDLHAIDLLRMGELELIEQFDDREAGLPDAPLNGALPALLRFAFNQRIKVIDVAQPLADREFCDILIVLAQERQLQLDEFVVQFIGVHFHPPVLHRPDIDRNLADQSRVREDQRFG